MLLIAYGKPDEVTSQESILLRAEFRRKGKIVIGVRNASGSNAPINRNTEKKCGINISEYKAITNGKASQNANRVEMHLCLHLYAHLYRHLGNGVSFHLANQLGTRIQKKYYLLLTKACSF